MILAQSCSFIGAFFDLRFETGSFTATYHSNKHIMIDLGTGNNNKMYVLLPY